MGLHYTCMERCGSGKPLHFQGFVIVTTSRTIAVIPARGGSRGIPRKNVRFLRGKPLIAWTIDTAKKCAAIDRVIVSTDDPEIAHVAEVHNCPVVMRPAALAADDVPLDPVIHHAVCAVEEQEGSAFDTVITLQPTSPLLSVDTLAAALEKFAQGTMDTLISVVDDRHLSWTVKDGKYVPMYAQRVNRQYLPANFRETGGFVIARRRHVTDRSRFGAEIDLFEIPHTQAIDIDDYMDWWLADKLLGRRRILLRAAGYEQIGLGHVYRVLMLASRLIDHELLISTDAGHTLGTKKVQDSFYPHATFASDEEFFSLVKRFGPHIVINDILDTDPAYVRSLKADGRFVVNFEDLGEGAWAADAVINALYEADHPSPLFHFGKDYYCLRDEFHLLSPREVTDEVKEVLITFGGTDPNDYTRRVLTILAGLPRKDFCVTVVTGLGYSHFDALQETVTGLDLKVEVLRDIRNISRYMHRADIVFTSAGRTVFEVASLGTPIIVLAQNQRELAHTFAREENGIVNLGLGTRCSDTDIAAAFMRLRDDVVLRRRLSSTMRGHNLRSGMDNVLRVIFEKYEAAKGWEQ